MSYENAHYHDCWPETFAEAWEVGGGKVGEKILPGLRISPPPTTTNSSHIYTNTNFAKEFKLQLPTC